jgi:hypothetical protein
MPIEEFADKVPKGFELPNNFTNSVYIAQVVNMYDGDLVDMAIGFRRDEVAVHIVRNGMKFGVEGRGASEVEMATGFKWFLDQLREKEKEEQNDKDDFIINISIKHPAKREDMISGGNRGLGEPRGKPRSRSRSKNKNKTKNRKAQRDDPVTTKSRP